MKSRSLHVRRRRMHFRRLSRLSALADKIRQKKNIIMADGKVAYWNSIPCEIISDRIVKQRLFARASLVNILPASKKLEFRNCSSVILFDSHCRIRIFIYLARFAWKREFTTGSSLEDFAARSCGIWPLRVNWKFSLTLLFLVPLRKKIG